MRSRQKDGGIRAAEDRRGIVHPRHFFPSILLNEVSTPRMMELEKPACSISFKPVIVIPLGVVTLSISCSGWSCA
jgi:hypothetical protein